MYHRGFFIVRIFICFIFLANICQAQLDFTSKKFDFGLLQGDDKRYTDFEVVNSGKEAINILRVDNFRDRELQTKISDVYLMPGETATIRVQINPLNEGRFSKQLAVYTSSDKKPIILEVKGNTKNLADLQRQSCPDFNDNRNSAQKSSFRSVVVIYDALTGESIKKAKVELIQADYGLKQKEVTNASGECNVVLNPGRLEVKASADGYDTKNIQLVVNRSDAFQKIALYPLSTAENNYEVVETVKPAETEIPETNTYIEETEPVVQEKPLASKFSAKTEYNPYDSDSKTITEPLPEESAVESEQVIEETEEQVPVLEETKKDKFAVVETETTTNEDYAIDYGSKEINDPKPIVTDTISKEKFDAVEEKVVNKKFEAIAETEGVENEPVEEQPVADEVPEPIEKAETTGFEESKYKANNVVFLIDKSVSMSHKEKLDITKKAVVYLISRFREIDQLGVVVYDTDAKVLIESTNGKDVKTQVSKIEDIEPSGKTYGAKGLREAFEMGVNSYLDNGVNQIFVVTDGAFTEDISKVERVAKRCAAKGIQLNFIGVNNHQWTEKSFENMAKISNGGYLHLSDIATAEELLFTFIKQNSKLE